MPNRVPPSSPGPPHAEDGTSWSGLALIVTGWTVWSMDPLIVMLLGEGFPRLPLVAFGSLLGGAAFLVPSLKLLYNLRRLSVRHRWLLGAQVVLFTAGASVCYVTAIRYIHPGIVSAVLRSQVALAVVWAVWFLGERLTRLSLAGIALILAGNALLLGRAIAGAEASSQGTAALIGWLLAFAAAALWSGGTIASKVLLKVVRPTELMSVRMLAAGTMVLCVSLALSGWAPVAQITARQWGLLAVKGVGTSALGFLLYFYGLRHVRVYLASAVEALAPLLTITAAWLALGKPIEPGNVPAVALLVVGCLVVVAGHVRGSCRPVSARKTLAPAGRDG